MKKILLVLFCSLSIILHAQIDFPNGGMENWENVGSDTEEPLEWNSIKTGDLCGFCALGAQKLLYREGGAGNFHSGLYSARIVTKNFGGIQNGVMTLGRVTAPNTTPSNGYNITVQSNPAFNHGVNSQPDSLVFWAKYVPQDATDSARVSVVVHDNYDLRDPQDGGSTPHVRSRAVRNFRTGGVFVRMSIPFTIINAGITPTYVIATFTSSKTPGVGTNNTTLYIDDAALIYNPVLTTNTISPLVYYVSASQGASVNVPYTVTGTVNAGNVFTAQLSNSSGSFASPVNIGNLSSTASGTVSATIPAGTTSGTQYRIRTIGSNYPVTGTNNGTDIQVVLVSNSIAPTATQDIQVSTNGTAISVTETAGVLSREWKYATTSGGPYLSFVPAETGTSYTPNFATAGSYYVVCETTYPNGIVVTSNEVQINVVGNSVSPSGSQSILVSVNGTTLNVTETPIGTSREWMFSTTPGGPYSSFAPTETSTSYIPNFASPGVYYVVCVSTISSISCTSNEVVINVGSATLSTGTIIGSPFEFSPNAPDASVSVPYTVSGALNPGNTFTAELSDASGSFVAPTVIGSVSATTSGTISATIDHTTLDGTGYRIRVTASDPAILGSDNGTDLIVDQFDNSASPSTTQNIMYGVNGTPIAVTESQTSTRNWKFATVSGGPYSEFTPTETGASYTPNFATPGTYYVVCVSENVHNDTVVSNETQINVGNGTNLNTSSVGSSTYYLSPNAVVTDNVTFTSDIIFAGGNTFTAEISDATGSFALPTIIGTLSSSSIAPVPVTIPNGLTNGTGYRIRINSSSPAVTGTDNGVDLSVVQFEISATPIDTQYIIVSTNGTQLNVNSTHPTGVSNEWKYKIGLNPYTSFIPAETGTDYTPNFASADVYYIKCFGVNMWNDTVETEQVVVYVNTSSIEDENGGKITAQYFNDVLNINLSESNINSPNLEVLNMSGQVLYTKNLVAHTNNIIPVELSTGLYVCRITGDGKAYSIKFVKP